MSQAYTIKTKWNEQDGNNVNLFPLTYRVGKLGVVHQDIPRQIMKHLYILCLCNQYLNMQTDPSTHEVIHREISIQYLGL